ncbi:hypothetical protein ACFE04_021918 [Oxalis oulophora]
MKNLEPSTTPMLDSRNTHNSIPDSRQKPEGVEGGSSNPIAAKKVQKADREKLRRDRLNEQFIELGNTLEPCRPKNDKATILGDTIQMLKDLTAEVDKLKSQHATLSEESSELTQEKNDLREEKASLQSDIENLNGQYQQRLGAMFPWNPMDPSVVVTPPYSYPIPMAVPPGPIPMPFPFFGNQNPNAMPVPVPVPCSTYIPYPPTYMTTEPQFSGQCGSTSHTSSKQDSKSKSVDFQKGEHSERCDDSDDVVTELELKIPGLSTPQDLSKGDKKGKQTQKKDKTESSSTRFSSPRSRHSSSSNSMDNTAKSNR